MVKYLDTYILMEVYRGNEKFSPYLNNSFVISDLTLTEFYGVLLRDVNEQVADDWFNKLKSLASHTSIEIMKDAVKFRLIHKNLRLSFFDCIGYAFACRENIPFVTGDEGFRHFKNVEFVKA